MGYMEDILYNYRVRRVTKTYTYAAGGTDQITVVGPCTEVVIHAYGTADAKTLEPSAGIVALVSRFVVQTNKRGTIWDMMGTEMEAMSLTMFGGTQKNDTLAGSARDGWSWVLPLTLDPGEMATCTITWGAVTDCASDLAGWTGVLRMAVVIQQPKSYFAFRGQVLGASGVIGVGAQYTQPQIPIIPGFALCGGLVNSAITNATTIVTNLTWTPAQILLSHGDDYLIDALYESLRAINLAQLGMGGFDEAGVQLTARYGIPWHMLAWRHTPVANNDSTQLTITNGATATFGPHHSRVAYIYISGAITKDAAIQVPSTAEVGGQVTLAQPARVISPSAAIGPAVINAGTQGGGTSLFNLRGTRVLK